MARPPSSGPSSWVQPGIYQYQQVYRASNVNFIILADAELVADKVKGEGASSKPEGRRSNAQTTQNALPVDKTSTTLGGCLSGIVIFLGVVVILGIVIFLGVVVILGIVVVLGIIIILLILIVEDGGLGKELVGGEQGNPLEPLDQVLVSLTELFYFLGNVASRQGPGWRDWSVILGIHMMRGVLRVFVVVLFGRVGFRVHILILGFVQVLWPRGSVIGRVGWFIARVGLRLILGPVSRHIVRRLGGVQGSRSRDIRRLCWVQGSPSGDIRGLCWVIGSFRGDIRWLSRIHRRMGGVGCGNAMILRGLSGIGGLVGMVIRLVLMVVRLVLMMVRRAGHDDTPNQSQAPTQHPE